MNICHKHILFWRPIKFLYGNLLLLHFRNDRHIHVCHAHHERPKTPALQPTASALPMWWVVLPSWPNRLQWQAEVMKCLLFHTNAIKASPWGPMERIGPTRGSSQNVTLHSLCPENICLLGCVIEKSLEYRTHKSLADSQ